MVFDSGFGNIENVMQSKRGAFARIAKWYGSDFLAATANRYGQARDLIQSDERSSSVLQQLENKENTVPASFVAHPDESNCRVYPGAHSYPIFDEYNTPVPAWTAMFNVFFGDEYPEPGVHDDNEGFYVVSGCGKMMLNGEEYDLAPGCAMLAPAGVPHAIKKVGSEALHIFLYHFPK